MQVIILFLWPWFASNTRDLVDGDLPALLTARAEGYVREAVIQDEPNPSVAAADVMRC